MKYFVNLFGDCDNTGVMLIWVFDLLLNRVCRV